MSRALKYEIPGVDPRIGMDEVTARGWEDVFAPALPSPVDLVVEIGFGRGEFLLELAAKSSQRAFVGVEISFKRCLKLARKVARAKLENVRLIEGRGQVFVKEVLDPGSVSELWVNFSDPWPKDRHAGRRLLQSEFAHAVALALAPRAGFHVATDDVRYADQIDEVLAGEPLLENVFAPDRSLPAVPGRLQTGYEQDWREAGRVLHFFEYRRRAANPAP